MVGGRAAVGVVLSVIIAACSPGREPSPSATVAPDPTPTPATAGATADPMTPSPTATATSTPVPVPPKPTGLHLKWDEAYKCDPDWGGICVPETATFTLTWTAPRAKGVEVRVYGVTTCFRTDARTGACLRRHVALPDDTRVLLATGEAAKGRLRKRLSAEELFPSDRGCAIGWRSKDGTPFYSIVIAAYSVGGHSIFAIAEPGHYDRRGCEPDTY